MKTFNYFLASFIFLLSASLAWASPKSFMVMVDSPAYKNDGLKMLANYEIVRDTTFCRGAYMAKALKPWKCLNRKKKYCIREYQCKLTNKLWNRKTEYRSNRKLLKKNKIFRGAPLNITFVKKLNGKYEDKLNVKNSAVQKNDSAYGVYITKKGDTLMKIAFQLYGDYNRWRDIYRLNFFRLNKMTKFEKGTRLKYEKEGTMLVKNRGRPYYIKWGDNLHVIAKRVYGNEKMWKSIWKNNPHQIKNPNLIFADFTLYYPNPNEEKEVFDNLDEFY